jgi:hypothetical protein
MRRSNSIRPDGVMVTLSRHQFSDSCLPPPNALQEKFYWRTVTLTLKVPSQLPLSP